MKSGAPESMSCNVEARVQSRAATGIDWPPTWLRRPTEPAIDVPLDWRCEVAHWPHDRWVRWRRLSAELQAARPHTPTPATIATADHLAYLEVSTS